MSDSVQPHRQQPTRLPCPWDSPGKNTGVGCHLPLQCMKVKSESEVTQSCPTLSDPMDCSLPGSSIHGIFQARVLEWGAISLKIITKNKVGRITLPGIKATWCTILFFIIGVYSFYTTMYIIDSWWRLVVKYRRVSWCSVMT